MSLALYNHDGTWFKVESPDVPVETIMNRDVMSLSMTEEMAKMDSGSVQLRDQNNVYSRILRPGARLKVSWGIRLGKSDQLERSPIEVMINSPSGGGDEGGRITYTCSFMALGFRGTDATRWYETGTKADVVADAMDRLGILPANREISFARGSEAIAGGKKVSQHESDFRFLVRIADEWRAAFRIGRDIKSQPIACFVDYERLAHTAFVVKMTSSSSVHLEYGGVGLSSLLSGNANVRTFKWKDDSMSSANGQGFRIVDVDGQPQVFSYIVEDEKVTTYRLVPELIEQELKQYDIADRTKLLAAYLSTKTFQQIRRFFVEEVTTTAPQGSGITVDANLMGDPTVTAGMIATFGKGFPPNIGTTGKVWWVRKVDHAISTQGYFTDVAIADAYAFSPTGTNLTPVGSTA